MLESTPRISLALRKDNSDVEPLNNSRPEGHVTGIKTQFSENFHFSCPTPANGAIRVLAGRRKNAFGAVKWYPAGILVVLGIVGGAINKVEIPTLRHRRCFAEAVLGRSVAQ